MYVDIPFTIIIQVVAGLRYNLALEVGESEYCEKDNDIPLEVAPSLEDCPVSNLDTVSQSCYTSVHQRILLLCLMLKIKIWYADVWMKPVYPLQFELLSLQSEV